MTKIYCNIAENGIEYRYEESTSPIYIKKIQWAGHGQPKVIEYLSVENTPEFRRALMDGIVGINKDNPLFYKALVKHGHGIRCGYYPLPLIFATPAERAHVAEDRNVRPPKESWIEFMRDHIVEHYGLAKEKPKAESIDIHPGLLNRAKGFFRSFLPMLAK